MFGCPLSLGTVRGKVYWVVGASSGIGEYIAYEVSDSIFIIQLHNFNFEHLYSLLLMEPKWSFQLEGKMNFKKLKHSA